MYRSIFSPLSSRQRAANFESYWEYCRDRGGELDERERDLSRKRARLDSFRRHRVLSRRPLSEGVFRRNRVRLQDDPGGMDPKDLLFANLYRFAYHEWAAVTTGWEATVPLARARTITDKIARYHVAEEICHGRLFLEVFRTFHLDDLAWAPVDPATQRVYRIFTRLPGLLLDQPAFISELLGVVFYRFVDGLLDDCLPDEPEARERVRELLHEIMVDEVAHIGQRRNFIGPLGIAVAPHLLPWVCGWLFGEMLGRMPAGSRSLDNREMVAQGLAFDYSGLPPRVMERTWVPTQCIPS
ncbi:MAG: hypothetical protein HY077_09060 [Elusimicrobia bacterium]|nr:hypothetical protein [Elusimicrobiota bacterium]